MSHVEAMLDAYRKDLGNVDRGKLAECIRMRADMHGLCGRLSHEDMVAELTKCIRTDLDCADICAATGAVLSRHTGYDANITKSLLEACRVACASCAAECESHASMHVHCRAGKPAADANPPAPLCSPLWDEEAPANSCPSAQFDVLKLMTSAEACQIPRTARSGAGLPPIGCSLQPEWPHHSSPADHDEW
jgi:hypothetical protein